MSDAIVLPDGIEVIERPTGIRFEGPAEALLRLRSELWKLVCAPVGFSATLPNGWELQVTDGPLPYIEPRHVAISNFGWLGLCREIEKTAFVDDAEPIDCFFPSFFNPQANSTGVVRVGPAVNLPVPAPLTRNRTERPVDQVMALLASAPIAVGRGDPASQRALREAEGSLGSRFPPSLRDLLGEVGAFTISYGAASSNSLLVYGLTDSIGLPNLVWAHSLHRTNVPRRYMEVARMHFGLLSNFPFRNIALDQSSKRDKSDEAPVVAAQGRPIEVAGEKVADNFGLWLLGTLETVLPDSIEMWRRRIDHPRHLTYTGEYGQPGPRTFVSICECGWQSTLATTTTAAEEVAQMHASNPAMMHEVPYWLSR